MKKSILLIICNFLIVTSITFAQVGYRDVVYLKNGGKVIGIIIEQIPNISIKIETSNGSLLVFKMDEIEKMVKEKIATPSLEVKQPVIPEPPKIEQPIANVQNSYQNSWAGNKIEGMYATFAIGSHNVKPTSSETKVNGDSFELEYDSYSGMVFHAQIVFQSKDKYAFLFGGTVDKYANGTFTSYYVGGHFYLKDKEFSPFLYLKGGYGFGNLENPFDSDEEIKFTGPYVTVGAGTKYYLGNSWGLYVEAGYKYQGTSADWSTEDSYGRTYKIETSQDIAGFQFLGGLFFYP
ncbi:MAG: porin family protein [Bacteroidetes bacterium]|nr:porin family protein [Bacteroidota bacterium]MBU1113751.1 porin family protein [Bacteroidota bacterium]MBU1800097.1 porin family protein [Bacteroidota bacterium]